MPSRKALRSALPRALACALGSSLLLALATPAHAYFDNYLTGTIIGTLNDKEAQSLAKSVRKALNDTADGQAVEWTYPAAGKRQQIDGTLTPVSSKTDQGQPCRRLKSDLKRGSAEEHWAGWFCKQSNGQWKSRQVAD
ncbi:RT0821/Lpp0805 family surface protein [Cupriavidus sp. IDO]|uniref:RT0821/Lpp0805 family surface protein n=1 Tax=Cupriavidus sp. IDO TaxID=1539142 RepID=UPI0005798FFF|nr:RT0821/Lpp0805 family surface protein [Cupriavidus sp. IDO]KWR91366.1 hypothetical protein RM96_04020 [Cupriavidus sp. IDO]